jgi:hypothetical protein
VEHQTSELTRAEGWERVQVFVHLLDDASGLGLVRTLALSLGGPNIAAKPGEREALHHLQRLCMRTDARIA